MLNILGADQDIWAEERRLYGAYNEPYQKQKFSAKTISFRGETKTITEWAKCLNISPCALRKRLDKKWDLNRALTQPPQRKGITFNGKTQSLFDWSEEVGINPATLENRLYKARWPIDRALTKPVAPGASRNPSSSKQITFNGKSQKLSAWAKELNLPYRTIRWRLVELGWSVEDAFTLQPSNQRLSQRRHYTFNGKTQDLRSWSQEVGIPYRVLVRRIKELKWPLARAFTEPVRSQRRKNESSPNSNNS